MVSGSTAKKLIFGTTALAGSVLVLDSTGVWTLGAPPREARRLQTSHLDEVGDRVADRAGQLGGALAEHGGAIGGHAWDQTQQIGGHIGDKAGQLGNHVWDNREHIGNKGKEIGGHIWHHGSRIGGNVADKAKEWGNHAWDNREHYANTAKEWGNHAWGHTKEAGKYLHGHFSEHGDKYLHHGAQAFSPGHGLFGGHFRWVLPCLQVLFAAVYYVMTVRYYPYWQGPSPQSAQLQVNQPPCATLDSGLTNFFLSWMCPQARTAHTFEKTGTMGYWPAVFLMTFCPFCTLCYANSFTDLNPKLGGLRADPFSSTLCTWCCSCCVIAQDAESLDAATGVETGCMGVSQGYAPPPMGGGMMPQGPGMMPGSGMHPGSPGGSYAQPGGPAMMRMPGL